MRWALQILLSCILSLPVWGQHVLRIDSAFDHVNTDSGLTLYQQLPASFNWQRVSSVHYGTEAKKGRAFFRCQSIIDQTIWLELTSHYIDTVCVSLVRPDTLIRYPAIHYTQLAKAPMSSFPMLPVRHRYFVLAIPLKANQPTTVFIEAETVLNDYLKFGLELWRPSTFLLHQQVDTLLWALFAGIYMMAALISLLNFSLDGQRIFLFYAFYVLGMTIYALLNDGWGIWLPIGWEWADHRFQLAHCLNLGLCSFLLFSHRFLALPRLRVWQWANPSWLWLFQIILIEITRYAQANNLSTDALVQGGLLLSISYALLFGYYVWTAYQQHIYRKAALFLAGALGAMGVFYVSNMLLNWLGKNSLVPDMLLFRLAFLVELLLITLAWLYLQRYVRKQNLMLEIHNRQQAQRLYEANINILNAQEAERSRLAQDLHDDLGGTLSALKGRIANESVQLETLDLIEKVINDLRIVSRNLLPPELEKEGLSKAIQYTTERMQNASKIKFMYVVFGQEVRLPQDYELNLYRIVAELLNNVVKHSKATKAVVQVIFHADYLHISVEDNGEGIKTGMNVWGIGLKNIFSRVEFLKSQLSVDSTPAKGTTVIVEVPYPS